MLFNVKGPLNKTRADSRERYHGNGEWNDTVPRQIALQSDSVLLPYQDLWLF